MLSMNSYSLDNNDEVIFQVLKYQPDDYSHDISWVGFFAEENIDLEDM